ncbi:MAG: hypothetical protein WC352_08165 [Candidatus Omnitrophota bacterium]|jgi:cholesterol transport system auxiliary component
MIQRALSKKTTGLYCLLGLLAIFSGCANVDLKKPFPEIKTYSLDLSRQDHAAYAGKPVSVRFDAFSAVPAFADRYLTYRTSETAYEQDFYNQLMTSPAKMTGDQAASWMKGSALVSVVAPLEVPMTPDYVVNGQLLELFGDYRNASSPKAVLHIQLTVSRPASSGTAEVLFQKVYPVDLAIDRPSPKALTEGWSLCLGQIMADFENDLKNHVSSPSPSR